MKLSEINAVVKEYNAEHPILPPLDPEIVIDDAMTGHSFPVTSAGVYGWTDNLHLKAKFTDRRKGDRRKGIEDA